MRFLGRARIKPPIAAAMVMVLVVGAIGAAIVMLSLPGAGVARAAAVAVRRGGSRTPAPPCADRSTR